MLLSGTSWGRQWANLCANCCTGLTVDWSSRVVSVVSDANGVAHFAPEKMDERYELFFRGGENFDTSEGVPLPRTVAVPTAASKLIAFFEISPSFRQVKHHLRDASKAKVQRIAYGIFAMGWRGSARHWQHYRIGYLLLAGLSTPLVLSVHSIVSFDFAVSQLPGWHTTVFPPYFVAGAVFSGFAMVMTLMIPARKYLGFEHVVTERHLEAMNKVMLVTGMMVSYGYLMEHFIAWYSGNPYEQFVFLNRATGPYRWVYYAMIFCNVLVPQTFWWKKARTSLAWMFAASLLINVGMWTERFIIIVTSLHRDYLPSSWGMFYPTWVDWSIYLGTLSFFSLLFLLFLRFVPAVAVTEVKELRHELAHAGAHAGGEEGGH